MSCNLRLTLTALNSLPVVRPAANLRVGGLETFAWSLARALSAEGANVSMALRTPWRARDGDIGGVRLLPLHEPLRNVRNAVAEKAEPLGHFPWVRVRQWQAALLWRLPLLAAARLISPLRPLEDRLIRLLERDDAEITITFGVSADSAASLGASKRLGRRTALWFQSNSDLDPRYFETAEFINEYGVRSEEARRCLARADLLIAQTGRQQALLQQATGQSCVVIPNPVELDTFVRGPGKDHRSGVLWIGRYDRVHKRPLLAIEIARQCPEIPFTMVVNRGDEVVEQAIRQSVPANVRIINSVSRSKIAGYFQRAQVFLSTGSPVHEGFPNVLLEAAASGTPIVSMNDFDRFLERSAAGLACHEDIAVAARGIRQICQPGEEWSARSEAGRTYVERCHSMGRLLESLLLELERLRRTSV